MKTVGRKYPIRRRRRVVHRRKVYPKRMTYRRRHKNLMVPYSRSLSTVPERLYVKLRYVDCINASVTGGVFTTMPYFQSSLYSPRGSGGHQPMYYDQWTPAMYTKYRVYGIGYKVQAHNVSQQDATWFIIRHQDSTTAEIALQTVLERNDAKHKMLGGWAGRSDAFVKGYLDVAKTLGVTRGSVRDLEEFGADYNVNPSRMAYLSPYLVSGSSTSNNVYNFTFELTYYCVLYNKSSPQAS